MNQSSVVRRASLHDTSLLGHALRGHNTESGRESASEHIRHRHGEEEVNKTKEGRDPPFKAGTDGGDSCSGITLIVVVAMAHDNKF